MIYNFSKNMQFNTRLTVEGDKLDQVKEPRLLGLVLRDDLSWKSNTAELTRRAFSRMRQVTAEILLTLSSRWWWVVVVVVVVVV